VTVYVHNDQISNEKYDAVPAADRRSGDLCKDLAEFAQRHVTPRRGPDLAVFSRAGDAWQSCAYRSPGAGPWAQLPDASTRRCGHQVHSQVEGQRQNQSP